MYLLFIWLAYVSISLSAGMTGTPGVSVYPWGLRLLSSVIRTWVALPVFTVLRCAGNAVPSAQNNSLGREKLFELFVLVLGQHGQDLCEISPRSGHCSDSLTEDREFILFHQWSLDQICDHSQRKLIFVFII